MITATGRELLKGSSLRVGAVREHVACAVQNSGAVSIPLDHTGCARYQPATNPPFTHTSRRTCGTHLPSACTGRTHGRGRDMWKIQ